MRSAGELWALIHELGVRAGIEAIASRDREIIEQCAQAAEGSFDPGPAVRALAPVPIAKEPA